MKWFDKWFAKMSHRAWNNRYMPDGDSAVYPNSSPSKSLREFDAKTSITFTIYPANGGYVVQHSMYKRCEDSSGPTLTLVNRSDDLGEAIAHIITIEALKA